MTTAKTTKNPNKVAKVKARQSTAAVRGPGVAAAADTPQAAKPAGGKKKAQSKPNGEGRASAVAAALRVLGETGQPMNCQEMIQAMAAKGYWTSPAGKTPSATLYSAILREIRTKGKEARFTKSARGKFILSQKQ